MMISTLRTPKKLIKARPTMNRMTTNIAGVRVDASPCPDTANWLFIATEPVMRRSISGWAASYFAIRSRASL